MKTHTTGKIDFIHIGVMRSGSTWLELALNENPLLDIRKIDSEINENNFLLEEFKEGVRSGLINEKFIYTPGSAKRIKSKFPDVKIIVVLRDPVKRLISGYFLYKSNHMDDEVGFQDFVSNYEKGKLNVHMGMYKEHLQSFLEEFDRSQLGVFIFDDLEKSPEKFVQNIYRFLGVDNGFVPGIINKKKNIGVAYDDSFLLKLPFLFKKYGFQRIYRILEKYLSSDNDIILRENREFLRKIKNEYKKENDGLDDIFNINTAHWYY